MNMMVKLGVGAAATAVRPETIVPDLPASDARLVELAERSKELCKAVLAAEADSNERDALFQEMHPELPRALLWRLGDPIGRGDMVEIDGKNYPQVDFEGIEKLRTKKFLSWVFVGTKEQLAEMGLEECYLDGEMKPVVGYEELFVAHENKQDARRALEIVEAYDHYCAEIERVQLATGSDAADEAYKAIFTEIDKLVGEARELKPTTFEGFKALGSIIVHSIHFGEIKTPRDWEGKIPAVLLSALSDVPIGGEAAA